MDTCISNHYLIRTLFRLTSNGFNLSTRELFWQVLQKPVLHYPLLPQTAPCLGGSRTTSTKSRQNGTPRKSLYGDEVREAVINAAMLGPHDTVLDVGAGTGFLTEAAAKVGGKVIAFDLSKSMTDEAISKLGGKNVEFKVEV